MSTLKPVEKRGFEDLFDMASGYVLDFTNASFAQMIQDVASVDIYHEKYGFNGNSKANRLRAFWETEADEIVGKVLNEILDAWEYEHASDTENLRYNKCREVTTRLTGMSESQANSAAKFLERKIELPDLVKLEFDSVVTGILEARIKEIEKGLNSKASLSVIFMCGSVLEGALLGTALRRPQAFNQSQASPKDKIGKVRPLHEWSLAQLIDVASNINVIKLDVQKFSHALRDFRNYIHPYQQMASGFSPNERTAEICFQVLKAALADLADSR